MPPQGKIVRKNNLDKTGLKCQTLYFCSNLDVYLTRKSGLIVQPANLIGEGAHDRNHYYNTHLSQHKQVNALNRDLILRVILSR